MTILWRFYNDFITMVFKREINSCMWFSNYSRRPLFRVLIISNVSYSEQYFKPQEYVLRNSHNLCCLFLTSLHQTFRYFERSLRNPGMNIILSFELL